MGKKNKYSTAESVLANVRGSFLTGSRYWNTMKSSDADYDIVVPWEDRNIIKSALNREGIQHVRSERFQAFRYIGPTGDDINIVPCEIVDYEAWRMAKETMKEFINISPEIRAKITYDKNYRVSVYGAMVQAIRSALLSSGVEL